LCARLESGSRHPSAIAEYVRVYNAERRRLSKSNGDLVAKLSRREAEIGREVERLVDAIAKGRGEVEPLLARIDTLRKERGSIADQLAQAAASAEVVTPHPASVERYAADVATLAEMVARRGSSPESGELVATLRRLVQEVIVHAEPNASGFSIEVKGRLAERASPTFTKLHSSSPAAAKPAHKALENKTSPRRWSSLAIVGQPPPDRPFNCPSIRSRTGLQC
jgi:site-specific DNA recombinase